MYLLNPNKHKSAAHLWTGNNTVCKMYGTGGMTKSRQITSLTARGKPICTMCLSVNARSKNPILFVDKEYEQEKDQFVVQLPML